jgi:hypothetical protein
VDVLLHHDPWRTGRYARHGNKSCPQRVRYFSNSRPHSVFAKRWMIDRPTVGYQSTSW